MQQKRLYRSINNRAIAGVAGGLGDYLGIDPTIVRILFVLIALATAVVPSFIAYIVLAAILPQAYTNNSYGQPGQQPQQGQQQQQPYQPGYPQGGSMQNAVDNVVKGVEQVGREIGNALGLNRQPGYPPQQNQPQAYQQPQPPYQAQPPTSTYQGSNQLENMGTPVSNAPQQQAEPAPLPPAPQPYTGEHRGYAGNSSLGNMGQGGNGGQGNNTMNQAQGAVMVMRRNPWMPVLAVALAFFFLPALIFAGLHIFGLGAGLVFHGVGFGVHSIGWLLGRLLPIVFIGIVIMALVSRSRRRRF